MGREGEKKGGVGGGGGGGGRLGEREGERKRGKDGERGEKEKEGGREREREAMSTFSRVGSRSSNSMRERVERVERMSLKYALRWLHISSFRVMQVLYTLKPFEDSEPTGLKVDIGERDREREREKTRTRTPKLCFTRLVV